LVGIGLFLYFLIAGLSHMTDTLTQVVVPGQAELKLTQPGTYTIFLEHASVVNGRIYVNTESINRLKCAVRRGDADGQEIPVRMPSGSVSYSIGRRSGQSVLEFFVDDAGEYWFACEYPDEAKGPEVVVAVGKGVGKRIFKTVMLSLASM